jgi:hypothetical protein
LFALGCLIFDISTGERPYDGIDDQNYEEIERRYTAQVFPSLDGIPYRDASFKCWTLQYTSVDDLRSELRQYSKEAKGLSEHGRPEWCFEASHMSKLAICFVAFSSIIMLGVIRKRGL